MHRSQLLLGILLIILITPITSGSILSPTAEVTAELPLTTMPVAIGSQTIQGTIQGIESNTLLENYTEDPSFTNFLQDQYNINLSNLYLYPLLGYISLPSISKITVIELQELDLTDYQALLDFLTNNVQTYTNVDITLEKNMFIYGTSKHSMSLDKNYENAITSILSLQLIENITDLFLALITETPLDLIFNTQNSIIFNPSDQGQITIKDTNNALLWRGSKQNTILIIEESPITIHIDSTFYIFPIASKDTSGNFSLTITPSDKPFTNIPELITSVEATINNFDNSSTLDLPLEQFQDLLTTANHIINGGLILINTSDTLTIDSTQHHTNFISFLRSNHYSITINPQSQTYTIDGDYRLIFLGDHLYTATAPNTDNGLTIPPLLIGIWLIAIALFILPRIYHKQKAEEQQELKYPLPLIIHIIMIIVTFFLIDREISFQFGISALDALFSQGITLIFALIILFQFIMWIIGYLILTIPIRIIIKTLLTYVDLQIKSRKKLIRTFSLPLIWVFTALYVKLIINILFLFIDKMIPSTIG